MNILVLHGPNLNLLGEREPKLYGAQTLAELNAAIEKRARSLQADVRCFQSNHEGALIDRLHDERRWLDGVLLNAAALTHTSVALRDAISAVAKPAIEVHLTDTQARESFRQQSFLTAVCAATFQGQGLDSYLSGLEYLVLHHRP